MKKFTPLLFVFIVFALLSPLQLLSQKEDRNYELENVKKNLPKMLGANNVGKEFWFTIPPCYEEAVGDNFIKIFVTAPNKTQVTVEVPGKNFFRTKKTIPNDVIEFNISPVVGQVYQRDQDSPYVPEHIYKGFGMHVVADDPIVVYVVVRYYMTSDGFLAIPVSSWGKEYIAASYGDMGAMYSPWKYPSLVGITAGYDKTTVKFTLGGNEITKTAGGMTPGKTATAILNTGDVWMFSSGGYENDLTGSKIIASKPVNVVSGNFCTNIPTTNRWCDYTVEMDLPTYTWGYYYNVPKVPYRVYPSIIRIFSKEPATKIYRDGAAVGNIKSSGGMLGEGYLEMRMVPMGEAPSSVVISGDKPIGVTLYNTGIQEDGQGRQDSDPFVCAMTPMAQYQNEITFCTPAVYGGDSFRYNYLNLVYVTDEYGMMPKDVEIAEVTSGEFVWKELRTKFPGADEPFKIKVDGKQYAVKTVTLPHDGVYKIRAKKPFAAYSFGYDYCDSYGYPTSAALMDLEKPDTVAPDPEYIVDCGDVEGATVTDKPDNPDIRSNLAMIVYQTEESFNYEFNYDDFVPGEAITTKWTLYVKDKKKDARAVITFIDRRGNDTTVIVNYYANKLDIEPKLIEFGKLKKGTDKILPFKVINRSDTYEGEVTKLKLKSKNQNFSLLDMGMNPISLPFHIMPSQEFDFNVRFDAIEEGTYIDSIGIGDSCLFEYLAEVNASVGDPVIYVEDKDFNTVPVGIKRSASLKVVNEGTTDLEITGYKTNTLSVYTHNLEDLSISDTNPLIIKPKGFSQFIVYFEPDQPVEYIDSIVFESNAGTNRDNVCNIKGIGIQPGLDANSYDWGRIRIDRPDHPVPPYDTRNGGTEGTVIMLDNTGTDNVRIESVNINELNPGDQKHFILPQELLSGFTLKPAEKRLFEVFCKPTETGEHKITITYNNSANSNAQSTLECIGILPKLETKDVDFGTTQVKTNPADKENVKSTKQVTFTNVDYEYADTVTITNLIVKPASGDISDVITAFGNLGFRYDKGALSLPVKIAPGESIQFPADFAAMQDGTVNASLSTVSDAEADVTSNWTGAGVTKIIAGSGGSADACVNLSAQIDCEVENSGTSDLVISKIFFEPVVESLVLFNTSDADGFTLKPGEKRIVKVNYQPTMVENVSTKLIFENDSENPDFGVDVSGTSKFFSRSTRMDPADQNVSIGREAPVTLSLNEGEDMEDAQVTRLDITVKYNNAFLGVVPDKITIGSDAQGFQFERTPVVNQDLGVITLALVSQDNSVINQEGPLVTIPFDAYLPVENSTESDIISYIRTTGNDCARIDSSTSIIKLNKICALNLRHVNGLFREYQMGMIRPNPVGAEGANLDFTLAMDGWINIRIIDAVGKVVATPVSDYMKMGEYEIALPVENLSSGLYQVEMRSGDFTQSQKLVIAK